MGRGVGPRVGLLDEPLVAPARSDGLVPARRGGGRVAVADVDGVLPVGVDGSHRWGGVHRRAGVVGPAGDRRSAVEVVGVHEPRPVADHDGRLPVSQSGDVGGRQRDRIAGVVQLHIPGLCRREASRMGGLGGRGDRCRLDGGAQDQGGGGGNDHGGRKEVPRHSTDHVTPLGSGAAQSRRSSGAPSSARSAGSRSGGKERTPHSQSIGTATLRLERSAHRATTKAALGLRTGRTGVAGLPMACGDSAWCGSHRV